ncbi:hypothetical protein COLO4_32472 [Corchorus olitorius]|uniref:Uncharacterized protein n=1 Tax=Corchorus olitorius TaxID=93759 RepID=A0A1R3GZ95_9ROSI|nr:hypothetical protein COLO4_32472 [Corchorus olitorius]
MAAPARTSSSSIPCRTNPNLKRSEISDPMRRSFSGNPFSKPSIVTNPRSFNPSTPANSPSDFPRRHSTGRESIASLRDSDKENSKDQNPKPTRVRSPAPSKVTKNFMSPTISAASKMNASPRKKILAEKNDSVRSSVSFSDVKGLTMEDNESTPEIALKKKKVSFSDVQSIIMDDEYTPEIGLYQKKASSEHVKSIIMEDNVSTSELTPQIGLEQKNADVLHDSSSCNHEDEEPLKGNANFDYKESTNDYDSFPETVTDEKDSVNVDPTFKISPRVYISPSCPVLAPLDADPSMPPYDPKTNFLSPRPQFLHYRPNPRIDLYREREGMQLEEHFASESCSDTDVTEETQSEGSQRESEDISSEETSKEEDEEEEELHVSEPNPIAPDLVEESVHAKRMSKPRFSTRSKFISLLLVLAFAYFSIQAANSPAFIPSMVEELSLLNVHIPPEETDAGTAIFDEKYYGEIEAEEAVDEDDHEQEDQEDDAYENVEQVPEIEAEDAVDEDDDEKEDQEDDAYENVEQVPEEHDEVNKGVGDMLEEPEAMIELDHLEAEENKGVEGIEAMIELDHLEAEENKGVELIAAQFDAEHQTEGVELAAQSDAEHQSNVNYNDQPSIIPQATENQPEVSKAVEPEGNDLNQIAEEVLSKEAESDNPKIEASTDSYLTSEAVTAATSRPEDQFLTKNTMAFSVLVLCLLAAIAFIYTRREKPSMPTAAAVTVEQPIPAKKSEYSLVSVGSKDTNIESKKVLKESNSYQSQETKSRKTDRRESLASSDYSMGSASYGSFTTYEKLPSKHGGGDEEIVTPVRRSSRIRKQVTSP